MKDSNFVSKGILLENINKDDFFLNLDLNKSKFMPSDLSEIP